MHVIGPAASDIVHQGMIALEFVSSVEDLQLMTFGHPTFSEVVHEAALAVDGRAIHAIQRKRNKIKSGPPLFFTFDGVIKNHQVDRS